METKNTKSKVFSCQANGNSMSPTIYSGDTVTIYTNNSVYDTGDIILYHKNDIQVLHRIVCSFLCSKKQFYITKGDALASDDEDLVIPSQIIGKVLHIQHHQQ